MMRIPYKSIRNFISSVVLCLMLLILFSIPYWRFKKWKSWKETSGALKTPNVRNFSIVELMGSTNVEEVVKPDVSTLLGKPSMPFLKMSQTQRRPFAVIAVTSQARFFNQRHSIRSTWYKWADELGIRIFFVIGFHNLKNKELYKYLEHEQELHDDLIIDNYDEGYYKLPGKILRMLKWFNSTYSVDDAPRFLIKTDHDVFINLPNMVKALKRTPYYQNLVSLSCKNSDRGNGYSNDTACIIPDQVNLPFDASNPDSYFIGGRRFENSPVESDPGSKWYIDTNEREMMSWSSNFFPTYTNGPCYIMSGNVVRLIYEASFTVPIYPFEDVYIVGMIAYDRLNLYISNINDMKLDKDSYCSLRHKPTLQKVVALHPVEHPLLMVKVCKRVKACKKHLNMSSSSGSMLGGLTFVLVITLLIVSLG